MIVLQVLGSICLVLGTLICMTGAYGVLKFPNFFARVHAASIPDTLGAGLCLLGMIFFTFTLTPEQGYDMKLILLIVGSPNLEPLETPCNRQARVLNHIGAKTLALPRESRFPENAPP